MITLSNVFAPLAMSQLALLGMLLLLNYRGLLARLLAFFCVCLVAYILLTTSLFEERFIISFTLGRLATLSPFILWMIAYLLFVDEGKIKPPIWIVIAVFLAARAIGQFLAEMSTESATGRFYYVSTQLLPQIVMLGFALHTIQLGFQGYADDLVEKRRQFRVLFVLGMGAVVVVVLGLGMVVSLQESFGFSLIAGLENFPIQIFNFYLFAISLLLNLRAFKLSDEALSLIPENSVEPIQGNEQATAGSAVSDATREKLEKLMKEEKLYTQTGLTISILAKRLEIQEYRLRRLINQSMQYRNFNQYLNNCRIEDASGRLTNTTVPISSIALEVGYSSLSVFNKAFKDRFEMTPSEYRQAGKKE